MEFAFATKGLRQTCEREARARADLGAEAATSLFKRLADIRAIDALLPPLPWLPIVAMTSKSVTLEFHPGYRLIVVANHGENPLTEDGRVDWTLVEYIKIVGIEKP